MFEIVKGRGEGEGGVGKEALDILGFWSAQERSTRYLGILSGPGGRGEGEEVKGRRRRPEKKINGRDFILNCFSEQQLTKP